MDTVNSLTDAQLLSKCKELGILPVPITETTRELIRKKIIDALNNRQKNGSSDCSSPNISSTSPKSSSTPILDRIGTRSSVVINSAASVSLDSSSDSHLEPMEIDEANGHEDERPSEPPLKRPFFSSTMRNSPLLKQAPVIDISPRDDGEKYLSEFGRRLSKMKTLPPNKELFKGRIKSDTVKETDFGSRLSFKNTKTYELKKYDQNRPSTILTSSNFISIVLVTLLVLFFATIGGYYFFIKSEFNDAYKQNYAKLVCNEFITKNCIEPENFDSVINAFKTIHIELDKRAVNYACSVHSPVSPKRPPFMTLNEASRFLNFRMDNDLKNLLLYVWNNNNFGVEIIEIIDDENYIFLDNIESIFNEMISKKSIGLIVLNPNLSFSCTILNYAKNYSDYIIATLIGIFGLLISYQLVKYFTNKRKKHEELVKDLVNQTIQMLQHKDEMKKDHKCSESYIPVNHIRDTLIPANKRFSMEKIWNEVKKTIRETESRVRVETRLVAGEEFEVWTWIGNHLTILPRDPNAPKKWQGQAFESQLGSISPTSCLKIRGMFNASDKDLKDVEDAVIKKCEAANCKILHCASNRDTASVYLKCASAADASIAYTELHGWWFDGKLVTVKYLRIERYNERFPESVKS